MVVGGWLCCVRLLELSWLSQELAWKDRWHLNSINYSAFGHLVEPRGNLKQELAIRYHLIQSSRQSSVYCNLIIGKCLTKGSEPTSMWKVHPEVPRVMWVGDNLGCVLPGRWGWDRDLGSSPGTSLGRVKPRCFPSPPPLRCLWWKKHSPSQPCPWRSLRAYNGRTSPGPE